MFADMEKRVKRNILSKALRAAMNVIADAVRADCPDVTGVLQAAITVSVKVKADGLSGTAKLGFGNQNIIAARVEWGHLEFGHLPGHKTMDPVQPHPFIWTAVDRALPAALETYSLMIESELIAREGL